jgi:hypothetical protein
LSPPQLPTIRYSICKEQSPLSRVVWVSARSPVASSIQVIKLSDSVRVHLAESLSNFNNVSKGSVCFSGRYVKTKLTFKRASHGRAATALIAAIRAPSVFSTWDDDTFSQMSIMLRALSAGLSNGNTNDMSSQRLPVLRSVYLCLAGRTSGSNRRDCAGGSEKQLADRWIASQISASL